MRLPASLPHRLIPFYNFPMEIARERFLDDSRAYHLTIGLRSRTTQAHSLLTSLSPEEREQVSAAIVKAMDQIEQIIRPHVQSAPR